MISTYIVSFSQIITKRESESDGFEWIQLLNGNARDVNQGARSIDGKDIIPLYKGYKLVYYVYDSKHEGYFTVTTKDNCRGIYSKDGKEVIPVSRGYTNIIYDGPYYSFKKGYNAGICDMNANEIIPVSRGYTQVRFSKENKHTGYFAVSKGDKHGVCDMSGAEVIPCEYNCIIFGMDKSANRHFKYMRNENEFIDLPLTLDENGYAIPYTIQPAQ